KSATSNSGVAGPRMQTRSPGTTPAACSRPADLAALCARSAQVSRRSVRSRSTIVIPRALAEALARACGTVPTVMWLRSPGLGARDPGRWGIDRPGAHGVTNSARGRSVVPLHAAVRKVEGGPFAGGTRDAG